MRRWVIAILLAVSAAPAGAADKAKGTATASPDRHYRFARLELATPAYSDDFKKLFDEKPSFDKLEGKLKGKGIAYALSAECHTAKDFPERVRARLEGFKPGDNLFDRGEEMTVIWKIMGIYPTAAECTDALGRLNTLPEPKA